MLISCIADLQTGREPVLRELCREEADVGPGDSGQTEPDCVQPGAVRHQQTVARPPLLPPQLLAQNFSSLTSAQPDLYSVLHCRKLHRFPVRPQEPGGQDEALPEVGGGAQYPLPAGVRLDGVSQRDPGV